MMMTTTATLKVTLYVKTYSVFVYPSWIEVAEYTSEQKMSQHVEKHEMHS
jgi:hypothetical protein